MRDWSESLSIFSPFSPKPALAKHLMGSDIICSQIRTCIFMQAAGEGGRRPCAGNVMLCGETSSLATLIGLFIAALFLAFTKGFHMDGDFFLLFYFYCYFYFFFPSQRAGWWESCRGHSPGSTTMIKAEGRAVMSGAHSKAAGQCSLAACRRVMGSGGDVGEWKEQ